MTGNCHVRCGVGENSEIISKSYLSLLADILTIVNSGKQKLALPFYIIEEMLYDWAFSYNI